MLFSPKAYSVSLLPYPTFFLLRIWVFGDPDHLTLRGCDFALVSAVLEPGAVETGSTELPVHDITCAPGVPSSSSLSPSRRSLSGSPRLGEKKKPQNGLPDSLHSAKKKKLRPYCRMNGPGEGGPPPFPARGTHVMRQGRSASGLGGKGWDWTLHIIQQNLCSNRRPRRLPCRGGC